VPRTRNAERAARTRHRAAGTAQLRGRATATESSAAETCAPPGHFRLKARSEQGGGSQRIKIQRAAETRPNSL
jgi:hypothetical protein